MQKNPFLSARTALDRSGLGCTGLVQGRLSTAL